MLKFNIHLKNPQKNLIAQLVHIIEENGIFAYPSDSGYALGCALCNKSGLARIRLIRKLDAHHYFTLMLRDLSHISDYAILNNISFRLLKKTLPGPYTFILPATKEVPNRLLHAKRKTVGIRISAHPFLQALLLELGAPLMSISLKIQDANFYDADTIISYIGKQIDAVVDSGYCPDNPSTVIDLSGSHPELVREGAGKVNFLNKTQNNLKSIKT